VDDEVEIGEEGISCVGSVEGGGVTKRASFSAGFDLTDRCVSKDNVGVAHISKVFLYVLLTVGDIADSVSSRRADAPLPGSVR